MTPYPADFGGYVIGALPYAGAEALRIAAWCVAAVVLAAAGVWLLGRARRIARPVTPGIRHLHRAVTRADDRHAPVTGAARGCPCCTVPVPPARRFNDDCWCAAPCGYPDCQANPWCPWCDDLSPAPEPGDCDCDDPCGKQWCQATRALLRGES